MTVYTKLFTPSFLEEYPEINEPQKDLELLAAMKRIDIDRLSASQK
jgi:hypothetical protein